MLWFHSGLIPASHNLLFTSVSLTHPWPFSLKTSATTQTKQIPPGLSWGGYSLIRLIIWNLIYLPRQPGWRCVMCQDVLTDLSIAQTLVNNAVLKMRYILYQWDRSDHLDYTEMPTVPFWSLLFWCLIPVHKYVKRGLWHSVFRNVNKYKKYYLLFFSVLKAFKYNKHLFKIGKFYKIVNAFIVTFD